MDVETLQVVADRWRTAFMVAAVIAFVAVVVWTFLRPRQQVEADAHLWQDDEK